MNLRDAFLLALGQNEDDNTTRLVYADWLDEQGEHEEADRQRKWPAARSWLLQLCQQDLNSNEESSGCSYQDLIEFGHRVVNEQQSSQINVSDETVDALQGRFEEFFQNWSIVTGVPLPSHLKQKSFYWDCCALERYWWVGGAWQLEKE